MSAWRRYGGFGEELAEGKEESDDDEYDEEDRAERPRDQEAQEREEADDPDPGPHPAPGEEEVCPPQVASQPRLPSRDQVDLHEAMGLRSSGVGVRTAFSARAERTAT